VPPEIGGWKGDCMAGLDWDALDATPLQTDPFDYIHATQALLPEARSRIPSEFPAIAACGSFSLDDAPPGPTLNGIIDDLQSLRFRQLMEKKFGIDLAGRATTVTIRGQCGTRDGSIHTDSRSKVLSILLYLNEDWSGSDGQLRLLRGPRDLADAAVEIVPTMGSFLAFRRSDRSWHGHTLFVGQRRVLQFNFVRAEYSSLVSRVRHRLSAIWKPQQAA
jgi:hypothetical protein